MATTVTVQESGPLTETQSQSVGQLINRRMVAGLPMPNRAASSLVALAPGVVMIDPGQGAENYPVFSVAGGRGRNQHFSLDGGNLIRTLVGHRGSVTCLHYRCLLGGCGCLEF